MALPATFVNATAVTPNDTNANAYKAIYVGGAGNVTVITVGGQTVAFMGVPVGATLFIETTIIKATGTTATNIVGLR